MGEPGALMLLVCPRDKVNSIIERVRGDER
jgi:hypothetical protein